MIAPVLGYAVCDYCGRNNVNPEESCRGCGAQLRLGQSIVGVDLGGGQERVSVVIGAPRHNNTISTADAARSFAVFARVLKSW